jgi:hypothetical protein
MALSVVCSLIATVVSRPLNFSASHFDRNYHGPYSRSPSRLRLKAVLEQHFE